MASYGVWAIVGICVLVLLIGLVKKRAKMVFRFFIRVALGMVSIYFLNTFLENQEISVSVGLNPVSALTVGTLGISGFALLYGIMLYKNL